MEQDTQIFIKKDDLINEIYKELALEAM